MNPTITIFIHGQEETLTRQEAITLRNDLRVALSHQEATYVMYTHRNDNYILIYSKAANFEAELTAAINEHQSPVAAFLNRLPDNHKSSIDTENGVPDDYYGEQGNPD